ncbi:hypothetical protein HAZT_HAZT004114 [Hyalella azteca]|uniref:DDE-1 domain-containing protein n=1 Tax=Hyalella azteca TaxID=294128 RepID=A0A6A0H3K5_HYAAZ|nr:hypothetical protein HAZT_HAZT004114 [Hyalella azteca]
MPTMNIINYDETNFTNDPGKSQMIFRRGMKYPERVMNFSKTSYSVMFAGTASGELLPPYVVYKGLCPLDRECVLRKLRRETMQEDIENTRNFVSDAVLEKLLEIRSPPTEADNAPKRRKAIKLTPGKSHTGPRASTSGSATTQIQKKQAANVRKALQFDKYSDDEENEVGSYQ